MTNEEAIKNIKELLRWYLKEEPMSETVYKREAVEMAIKALEQQPCEDCVSREEALLALTGMDLPTDRDKLIALFTERIQHLPPVTPQRPKGKWIMNSDYPDRLICDKCNAQFDVWHWESKQMHYCPNCGSYNGGEEDEQDTVSD